MSLNGSLPSCCQHPSWKQKIHATEEVLHSFWVIIPVHYLHRQVRERITGTDRGAEVVGYRGLKYIEAQLFSWLNALAYLGTSAYIGTNVVAHEY